MPGMDVLQGVQYVSPFIVFLRCRSLLNRRLLVAGWSGSKDKTYEMVMIAVDER